MGYRALVQDLSDLLDQDLDHKYLLGVVVVLHRLVVLLRPVGSMFAEAHH